MIEVKGLWRSYGEGDTLLHALRGVSLSIAEGEFTAVVGPSGSGKSTLLNLVGGLDHPSQGQVMLVGRDVAQMSGNELSDFRRDHIGFIFQAYNLIPVLTVEENVEYVMLLQGVDKAERRRRVEEILGLLGLADRRKKKPNQLSGGQQQRVAIARAVVSRPNIVLADEPTANLDSTNGAKLLDMMRQLNQREKTTFVFSTHDPMVVERARRVVVLRDGELASDQKQDA